MPGCIVAIPSELLKLRAEPLIYQLLPAIVIFVASVTFENHAAKPHVVVFNRQQDHML